MQTGGESLEQHLIAAGKRPVHHPDEVDELFCLLDEVEGYLSEVHQKPPRPMANVLCQLQKLLVADDLMDHPDIVVRVAVASCISEFTRISAPVAPYDDDEQMKKVFRLIVGAFEGLSDTSCNPSYQKRLKILEFMAKFRSCLLMVELKCDVIILDMFQHFLFYIRDYHPEHVFSDMETIMTLVLKESGELSVKLLPLLLDSVQNKVLLPIRQELAKKVIGNCFPKLKSDNESKSLENPVADTIPQEQEEAKEDSLKATGSGLLDLAPGTSSQSVMITSHDTQNGNGDDSLTDPSSTTQKKPECTFRNTAEAKTTDTAEKIKPDNLEPETEQEVQNPPEGSFDGFNNRGPFLFSLEFEYALKCLEAESRYAVMKEWTREERRKAAYEALKRMYPFYSWGKSKKAAPEALERIEGQQEREKAEFVKKMKNDVALLPKELKEAEEKPAMTEAKCGEEILKAEEIAAKHRASGTTPPFLLVHLLFVGALWICLVLYLCFRLFGAR